MFKTANAGDGSFGEKFSNILGVPFQTFDENKTITFDSNFAKTLDNDKKALDVLVKVAGDANLAVADIETVMRGASASAIDFAKNNTLSANSVAEFANQQRMSYVANMAQGTSLSNIQMLLNEYNSSLDKSANGITKCGLSQKDFVDSVNQTNAGLGGYLNGLNGANASMKGYIGSLIKAKISTIGLQLATTALNAVISFGISLAIQGVIKLWDEWIVTAKEAIEKSEEAADTIKSINDEFNSNKDKVDEIAEKYAKLAQGVDSLTGKNVSLTDDDYEEFLDLSNQLAEIFPTLTRGYDENGNAILNLSGNVDTIVGSLNNLLDVERQLANQKIIDNLPDLYEGIYLKSNGNLLGTTDGYIDEIEASEEKIAEYEQLLETYKNLPNLSDYFDEENSRNGVLTFDFGFEVSEEEEKIKQIIEDAVNQIDGYDFADNTHSIRINPSFGTEDYQNNISAQDILDKINLFLNEVESGYKEEIANHNSNIINITEQNKANWSSLLSGLDAWLYDEDSYKVMSDDVQNMVQTVVNGLDFSKLNKASFQELETYIRDNVLKVFSGSNGEIISAAINKMNTAFSQFQAGEISYDDYKIAVDGLLESLGKIDNLTADQKEALTMTFGIKFAEDGTTSTAYDNLVENVKGKLDKATDDIEGKVKGMSLEDLKIASQLEIPDGTILSWKDLQDEVKKVKNAIEEAEEANKTFTSRMSGIQGLQAGLDQLDKIYTDIADGKDFDYSAVLNNKDFTDAFSGLGESYNKFMETILNSPNDLSACQSAFDNLVSSYINNSKALDDLTESERNATVAALEQMGVSNAAIIVDEKIAIAKEKKRLETELGTDATFDEVMAMRDEEGQSYATIQALVNLATAKLDVNKSAIDLTSDINQIIALAEKAGASTASLKELARAKILFNEAEQLEWAASVYTDENGNPLVDSKTGKVLDLYTDAKNAATKAYQDAVDIMNTPIEYTLPEYKGGSTYRDYVDKAAKEAEKNKPEKYDWITTSIERTEREIRNAQKIADSAYKSLDAKLAATDEQIKGITKEINIQNKALKKYKKEADSVKLSEDIKAKVRDGSISIDKYDDKTQELINDYKEWYEKSLDCADAIAELDEELTSLYDKKFDDISTDYENQLSQIEHLTNTYENGLADLEARGYLGGQEYYTALQQAEQQKIALLEKELADLTEAMNTAIDEGMEVNSSRWYDMQESINGVKEEIQSSNTALIEYQNSIDELDWEAFDFMQERISAITNEAEFLIKLLDDSDLFDEKGRITGKGLATAGLHAVSYNTYMKQSEEYAKKILEINAKLANDPSNPKLIEQREELLELQRESILAAKDEKDAIIDMIEEGINQQLDSMKELIDSYKDSLRSAKDLYEYQKRIKDQTSNIASLEKQLAAYENDESEETRAKIQQIRVDLEKAREELEETEYDKYISDTEKMLDNFYEDYEDTLNSRMDNIEILVSTMIDAINFGANGISSIIQLAAEGLGYTITDEMRSIWSGFGNVVGEYGTSSFGSSSTSSTIDGVISGFSGLISAGSEIANSVIDAFTSNNSINSTSGTESSSKPANKPVQTPAKDEKPKEKQITVGGKINAGSATIYANSSGKNGTKQYFAKDPIYVVLDEENGYLKVRHHSSSSGVTGWFKKSDVKAYKTGGLVDYTGIAQLDGTPSKPELVLNSRDTENFIQLKDVLQKMAENNVQLFPSSNYINGFSSVVPHGILDMSSYISKYREPQENSYSVSVGDINTTIEIDHVMDYDDFVSQIKIDPQFERFIGSITLDKLVGGSKLSKYKYWK